jgi:hypothetical protein
MDSERHSPQLQAASSASPGPDASHPLMSWPMAPVQAGSSEILARRAEQPARRDQDVDDVAQLAGALRAAKRARHAYLAELRQGDVEPAEDWSKWYAEYLLGLR